ncbi:hypothetical protein HP439_00700 [Sphingobacterium shayense]|uniref:hypothetical protein n=1 Tax=Sphingobacterium shayense TaxID=626343 RepID=UPI001555B078|nr:hypothetical protein [Sphingobacterium shayense]NQD69239.1 hypothetical protein [Sphingobacterium shayense]
MENNYQLSRIHNYVQGLMNKEDMHTLEREALNDPFLQDAIEGYKLQQGVDAKSLSLLQQRLERRIAADREQKNRFYFSGQRLAIALTAAVMFVAVCTLLMLRYLPSQSSNSETEVLLMDDFLQRTSVVPLAGSDAVPLGGWDEISEFISQNYSGLNENRRLQILFKVNAKGVPYDIQPQVDSDSDIYKEIVKILQVGPKWSGTEGNIEIVFPE